LLTLISLCSLGRTGTVISCYLIFTGYFDDPQEALLHFAYMRSLKERGVTQVSQKRFAALPPRCAQSFCRSRKNSAFCVRACVRGWVCIDWCVMQIRHLFSEHHSQSGASAPQIDSHQTDWYAITLHHITHSITPPSLLSAPRLVSLAFLAIVMMAVPCWTKKGCRPYLTIFNTSSHPRELVHSTRYSSETK